MTVYDQWIPAAWPAADGIVAGTTLRRGGVSQGSYATLNLGAFTGDEEDAVVENRRRFGSFCGLPSGPRWLRQVHGATVIVEPPAHTVPEADAAITRSSGVVCAVLTADCLPVIFASADGAELGVAHAGWRGLAGGVLEAAVNAMSCEPGELLAWLGPAISQTAYEVGAEVRQRFLAQDAAAADCFAHNERDRWQADLYGLARMRLGRAGVKQVSGGEYCTFSEPERFYSYRRDGACGRMASFVFRMP